MATLRGLLSKARRIADDTLPDDVKRAGRRLREEVVRRAPPGVAEVLRSETDATGEVESTSSSSSESEPSSRREDILERVHQKPGHGLKPEDRLVVIYATDQESEQVEEVRKLFSSVDTVLRTIDLDQERPQTRAQIAKLTGVMVPPWIYINGRYWGGPNEMIALEATGDLEAVVAHRFDELGDDATRIGRDVGAIHESYIDDISVENILERWKLGHILTVDDLDAWYEVDKDGTERFFYQGGPHPVDKMHEAAKEVVAGYEAGDFETQWLREPAVQLD